MTVKTRAALNTDADTTLADNTDGDISPLDVRQRVKDLADSAKLDGDTPQFTAIELGHATDTTVARAAAGQLTVEGSRVYQRNNILGTVSQSGGVPTGAAFELGSNANGFYERTAGGILTCRSIVKADYVDSSRISTTWIFPSAFADGANRFAAATFSLRNKDNTVDGMGITKIRQSGLTFDARGSTTLQIEVRSSSLFSPGDFVWIDVMTEGRWF